MHQVIHSTHPLQAIVRELRTVTFNARSALQKNKVHHGPVDERKQIEESGNATSHMTCPANERVHNAKSLLLKKENLLQEWRKAKQKCLRNQSRFGRTACAFSKTKLFCPDPGLWVER